MNFPVTTVLFPNYLASVDQLLKDLLVNADDILTPKYHGLRPYIRELRKSPAENSCMSLTACYEALKGKDLSAMVGIPDERMKTKHLIEDIACVVIKRATACVRRITGLAKNGSATELDTSKDFSYFVQDLQVVHAVLSSRQCFIPDGLLRNYLVALEDMQAATGHNPAADIMGNKLRNILKNAVQPRAKVQPAWQKPAAAPVVETIDAPAGT